MYTCFLRPTEIVIRLKHVCILIIQVLWAAVSGTKASH